MMKFVNRVVLMLCMASVFSVSHINDVFAAKCSSVDAGRYCFDNNDKEPCPEGCWCEHMTKVDAVSEIDGLGSKAAVRHACSVPYSSVKAALAARGVHYCPEGTTTFTKDGNNQHGAKTEADCKPGYTAMDGSLNCTSKPASGMYCRNSSSKQPCPKGCYCDGTKNAIGEEWLSRGREWQHLSVTAWCSGHMTGGPANLVDYLGKRGIHYCPKEYPKSNNYTGSIKKCYNDKGENFPYDSLEECINQGACEDATAADADDDGLGNTWLADHVSSAVDRIERTACQRADGVWCVKGKYMPKDGTACAVCKSGFYCPYDKCYDKNPPSDQGLEPCPANKPNSAEGATSTEQCVAENGGGGSCASGQTECQPGHYLNGTFGCAPCMQNAYCPGGCFPDTRLTDEMKRNGIYMCPDGWSSEAGSDSPDDCVQGSDWSYCEPGQYYNEDGGRASCVDCPKGYECPNGTKGYRCGTREIAPQTGTIHCSPCPDGQMANSTNTECVSGLINVPAGYYLKANSADTASCVSASGITAKQFCPGGSYAESNERNGIETCPYNGSSTSDKEKCKVTLTKKQLERGVNGNSNCYTYIDDDEEYWNCVFPDLMTAGDDGFLYSSENKRDDNDTLGGISGFDGEPKKLYLGEKGKPTNINQRNVPAKADVTEYTEADDTSVETVMTTPKEPIVIKKVEPGDAVQATPLKNVVGVNTGAVQTGNPVRSTRSTRSVQPARSLRPTTRSVRNR